MNNLDYASRQVFKPRMVNVIKLISLTVGLALGALMFTALAYNFTFDNFYKESSHIYVVYADYVNGDQHSRNNFAFAPTPLGPAAEAEIQGVECSTRFFGSSLKMASTPSSMTEYGVHALYADRHYFRLFQTKVLAGDTVNFAQPGSLFLTETKAREIFLTTDVVGKSLLIDGVLYMVNGIVEDIPDNSSWRIDAIVYQKDEEFSESWIENQWCSTFLLLSPKTSFKKVERELSELQSRHYDVEGMKAHGKQVLLSLEPLESHHNAQGSAMSANIIILVLGIVILSTSGLNYVLLSISSINSRAKEIGVHKCSGASKTTIFSLLLSETLIYIVLASVLAFLAIVAFRGSFETMTSTTLLNIFCPENLYAVGITIVLLFLLAGVIPAQVFSSVPVTQVFHQQSNRRTPWKKALLLIQLFATVFILCFLVIVIRQNNILFSDSHGINMDPVVIAEINDHSLEQVQTLRDELERKENVRLGSLSSNIPLDYPNLAPVVEAGSETILFSSGIICSDERFLEAYEIPLLMGRFHSSAVDTTTVTVNETFLKQAGWSMSEALGKRFMYRNRYLTIGGVVKDFHLHHYKILEQFPLIISGYNGMQNGTKLSVVLNQVTAEEIASMNGQVHTIFPMSDAAFIPYKDVLFENYQGEVVQKKVVGLSAVAIFLLSFIGIISYVSAEVSRRKREIAIRRINGATIREVLKMLSTGTFYYALFAAVAGSVGSLLMALNWQQEFFVKSPLSPLIFLTVSLIVIVTVYVTTIMQSYKIVSANPAEVMRSAAQ